MHYQPLENWLFRILCGYPVVMRRFLVNQYVASLGMEQPALLKHVGSTALRVAVARLRNSPCP